MEDNLAVPSKYRAGGNDGSSDCRLTREGVSHIGDGVTGDCRYELNVGGEWKGKGTIGLVERAYCVTDGPMERCCL